MKIEIQLLSGESSLQLSIDDELNAVEDERTRGINVQMKQGKVFLRSRGRTVLTPDEAQELFEQLLALLERPNIAP